MTVPEAPLHAELEPEGGVVEAAASHRRLHPVGLRCVLAGARQPQLSGGVGVALAVVFGVAAIAVAVYGVRFTAGTAPRPTGPEARRIERSVTVATVNRTGCIVRVACHRHRHGAQRLGPSVHRDHDRADDALVRPPRAHSPVPRRRLGADRRTGTSSSPHCRGRRSRRRLASPPDCCSWAPPPPASTTSQAVTRSVRVRACSAHGCRDHEPGLGDHMSFRPFFNPATGEWIEYTAVAEDSNGELVRFNWRSVPGGVITEHIHPHQEERFTITTGQARFTLKGEEHLARAGETIVVPAGVPHSEGNTGSVEIEGVVELRPGLHTKEWHEALAGLVVDGKTTPQGRTQEPAATRRHLLAFPSRKSGHFAADLGAEPRAPTLVGAGEGLRRTPLPRALGQPCS